MISLENWFYKKSKKPLLIAAGSIVAVQCCIIALVLYQTSRSQVNGIKKVVSNMATLGIEQSNRNLIESAAETAVEHFGVNTVLICSGTETEFSFPFASSRCDNLKKEAFFEKLIKLQPSGFEKYQMYFYADKLHGARPFIWMALFLFLFIVVVLSIIFWVQNSFKREIITPIGGELLSDKPVNIVELENLRKMISEKTTAIEAQAKASVVMNHKKSLSHNIRSKVQTLKGVYADIKGTISKNDQEVMESLIKSFSSMTDKLSHYVSKENQQEYLTEGSFFEAMKIANEQKALTDITSLVQSSLELKEKELSSLKKAHIKISSDIELSNTFSLLPELELYSIISNILNNSIEADCTKIDVKLKASNDFVAITVTDNGNGVPENIKSSLFSLGKTEGKEQGTGYGLFHAYEFTKSWGGSIEFVDVEKDGSVFKIKLPLWRHPKIKLENVSTVAVLDDDEMVHQKWNRLLSEKEHIKLKKFTDSDSFAAWVTGSETNFDGLVCFVDNDLGEEQTSGSELIESLGIKHVSSLVTNRYDDPTLIRYCASCEINLIPKPAMSELIRA